MRAPLYEWGLFGDGASLAVALVVGIAFGWFLERGGMGNARKLAAQFYLRDLTVFKLLFTAVITAMLGLFWLGRSGWLEPALVYVPPTWVVPQLLGGLLFGVGFVMGGLCPGTSCVAISSGRADGLAVLAGMLFGILAFGEAFPLVDGLYHATPVGTLTLSELFGIPYGLTVLLVTAGGIGAFALAEHLERERGGPIGPERQPAGAAGPEIAPEPARTTAGRPMAEAGS